MAWEPVVEPWTLHVGATVLPPSAGWLHGVNGAGCRLEVEVPGTVDITLTEVWGVYVVDGDDDFVLMVILCRWCRMC